MPEAESARRFEEVRTAMGDQPVPSTPPPRAAPTSETVCLVSLWQWVQWGNTQSCFCRSQIRPSASLCAGRTYTSTPEFSPAGEQGVEQQKLNNSLVATLERLAEKTANGNEQPAASPEQPDGGRGGEKETALLGIEVSACVKG